jgi:hypothetical protein
VKRNARNKYFLEEERRQSLGRSGLSLDFKPAGVP